MDFLNFYLLKLSYLLRISISALVDFIEKNLAHQYWVTMVLIFLIIARSETLTSENLIECIAADIVAILFSLTIFFTIVLCRSIC